MICLTFVVEQHVHLYEFNPVMYGLFLGSDVAMVN